LIVSLDHMFTTYVCVATAKAVALAEGPLRRRLRADGRDGHTEARLGLCGHVAECRSALPLLQLLMISIVRQTSAPRLQAVVRRFERMIEFDHPVLLSMRVCRRVGTAVAVDSAMGDISSKQQT